MQRSWLLLGGQNCIQLLAALAILHNIVYPSSMLPGQQQEHEEEDDRARQEAQHDHQLTALVQKEKLKGQSLDIF